MAPKLLVISFYFPPYPRVGGRRWAKHVKHLVRMGVDVHVLAGDFSGKNSSWDDDIRTYTHRITRVQIKPARRPWFETHLPDTFAGKVRWQWSYQSWKFRRLLKVGNHSDASLPNLQAFLQRVRQVVREKKIEAVILSVGPNRYAELLVELRRELPHLKLVMDYRDPWEVELDHLTPRQKKYELRIQQAVVNVTDLVLTVNDDISAHIKSLGAKRVFTLPHAVDEDYLSLAARSSKPRAGGPVKFVYGGELYGGMEPQIQNFVSFMQLFRKHSGTSTQADFYSHYPSYQQLLKDEVRMHTTVPKETYQKILEDCDCILLFKGAAITTTFFSSKFFELICLRKPILFFGEAGKGSEFLLANRLGYHVHAHNLEEAAKSVADNLSTRAIPAGDYDLTPHAFEYHTQRLVQWLSEL